MNTIILWQMATGLTHWSTKKNLLKVRRLLGHCKLAMKLQVRWPGGIYKTKLTVEFNYFIYFWHNEQLWQFFFFLMKQKIKHILCIDMTGVTDCNLSLLLLSSTVPWKVPERSWVADDYRRGYTSPVFSYILMIWILWVLHLLWANIAEHDTKGKETKESHHQTDVDHAVTFILDRSSTQMHRWMMWWCIRSCSHHPCLINVVLQPGYQQSVEICVVLL